MSEQSKLRPKLTVYLAAHVSNGCKSRICPVMGRI